MLFGLLVFGIRIEVCIPTDLIQYVIDGSVVYLVLFCMHSSAKGYVLPLYLIGRCNILVIIYCLELHIVDKTQCLNDYVLGDDDVI